MLAFPAARPLRKVLDGSATLAHPVLAMATLRGEKRSHGATTNSQVCPVCGAAADDILFLSVITVILRYVV